MKMASIFCSPISFCALAIRAWRSSAVMGTMPDVMGLSARMASGAAACCPVASLAPVCAQLAAATPAPTTAAPRNSRRFMDTGILRCG
jgi:hypothetical protein